jgi:hypothetical protein
VSYRCEQRSQSGSCSPSSDRGAASCSDPASQVFLVDHGKVMVELTGTRNP